VATIHLILLEIYKRGDTNFTKSKCHEMSEYMWLADMYTYMMNVENYGEPMMYYCLCFEHFAFCDGWHKNLILQGTFHFIVHPFHESKKHLNFPLIEIQSNIETLILKLLLYCDIYHSCKIKKRLKCYGN
jgi:hypothetical protein